MPKCCMNCTNVIILLSAIDFKMLPGIASIKFVLTEFTLFALTKNFLKLTLTKLRVTNNKLQFG